MNHDIKLNLVVTNIDKSIGGQSAAQHPDELHVKQANEICSPALLTKIH